jgi:3-oxoacyl-(acyl-carrier-protein) synthase
MSLCIAGMGWVTPLGSGVSEVWDRLLRGESAVPEEVSDPVGRKTYPLFRVPNTALKDLAPHPRLRRASAISRFAAAAGLAALKAAGSKLDTAGRIALVLAVANGGVIYTKRFYHDIVESGAEAASPLLFPETVFNAPASHLAAIIGLTGASYTVVGDGAVGLSAIRLAEDLMEDEGINYCLVVGAEEADWILCDAYWKWRLLRSKPPIEPFLKPARGTILSEGAGAILLGRQGSIQIDATDAGAYYSKRSDLSEGLKRILRRIQTSDNAIVIGSANGTFIDCAEARALSEVLGKALVYTPKGALGESVGAGGLWQVIVAAQALQTGQLPAVVHASSDAPLQIAKSSMTTRDYRSAIITNCGLNQQISALRLSV